MTFKDFSKNLSSEIENLFATLGDSNLPENAHRLDQTINIDDILARMKNLDATEPQASPNVEVGPKNLAR